VQLMIAEMRKLTLEARLKSISVRSVWWTDMDERG